MADQPESVGDIISALPAPRRETASVTPPQMLQLAIEKGADVAMLERLMALQERWEANEARKAFVQALSAFKAAPPTVMKNRRAGFDSRKTGDRTEYEYATLDQVCALIGAALSRYGLSYRWETAQGDGKIRVACILTHAMGHTERTELEAGADMSGSKNAIQAIGSTVTYLERYTLLAATGLAAKGQDDDAGAAGFDFITDEQKAALVALIRETGADTKKFLAYIDAPSVDEIPAARFENAKAALERKKGKA